MPASSAKTPVKRATPRRKRGTLTREIILDAALKIVDEEGFDALSMPRLAREVKAGTMTLYGYIKNRKDLIDALIEQSLSELAQAEPDGRTWQEVMLVHFRTLRASALKHPSLGKVIASQGIMTPSVVKILNDHFAVLRKAGFKKGEAVHLYYTLLIYTLGFVSWEVPRVHDQSKEDYKTQWQALLSYAGEEEAPILHDLKKKLYSVADEDQFEWGIAQILNGYSQ